MGQGGQGLWRHAGLMGARARERCRVVIRLQAALYQSQADFYPFSQYSFYPAAWRLRHFFFCTASVPRFCGANDEFTVA